MKLSVPEEDERSLRVLMGTFRTRLRNGIVILTWTVASLIAVGAAFLVLRAAWSFLLLGLRALGEM